MKNVNSQQFQPIWGGRARKILLLAVLGMAAGALATPPVGFVVNQILAMGTAMDSISQQVQMGGAPDGSDEPWQVQLHAQGASDFYLQQLALAPGGYNGWHTHPGILVGTAVSRSIDFYDANCQKHSYTPGQVYVEN